MTITKKPLLGMTLDELKAVAAEAGLPPYAARQMADWIYKKRIGSIAAMTNIAAARRAWLDERYEIGCHPPTEQTASADGTIKYLFPVGAGRSVESVYIPADDRNTLCVSSQVGCKMDCLFCMTGKQGFRANLTAAEILNQIQSVPETAQLTNLVFMGMGEPLDNVEQLFDVLEILTADYGYGWSPKRITVSTVGVMRGLRRLLDEQTCHVAISIHSPFADERLTLMPVEKAYPIADVLALLRQYDFTKQRRLSFEYIMFDKRNDTLRHAKALAALLRGIPCRVNLIRYHAIPNVDLQPADDRTMEQFRDTLNRQGLVCTIRASRGEDIMAACGMLSTARNAAT